MSMLDLTSVQVVQHYKTSAVQTFAAWLDARTLGSWLFAAPTGQMSKVVVDAKVGGHFTMIERRNSGDIEHHGKYLVIDPPHHLAFSYSVAKESAEHNRVSVGIVEDGAGCKLTLTHAGVPVVQADKTKLDGPAVWRR